MKWCQNRVSDWVPRPVSDEFNQDRVSDWVPSLVWDEMGPRQGQGLGAKAGVV